MTDGTDPGSDSTDPDPDGATLRALILAQSAGAIGVPVTLFSDPTVAPDARTDGDGDADRVAGLMRELAIDPATLQLFGTDAYVLQTALGARLLPDQP